MAELSQDCLKDTSVNNFTQNQTNLREQATVCSPFCDTIKAKDTRSGVFLFTGLSLFALCKLVRQYTVEDSAFGFVVMENGATVFVESAWALNTLDVREAVTSVCGTEAGADMVDGLRINGIRKGRQYVLKPDFKAGGVDSHGSQKGESQADLEARLWIDAVKGGAKPLTTPEQAYCVTRILEGIYESSKTGEPYYFN